MEAEDPEFLGIGQSVTYPAPLVPNRKELSRMTRSPGPTRVCVWEGSSLYPTLILRLFLQWLLVRLSWYHLHPSGQRGDLLQHIACTCPGFLVLDL